MPSRLPAVLAVVVGLLALTVPAAGASTGPVAAKAKPGAPGSLTGYGFDACSAPPQAVMDAWWEQSPYSAVGIYIGGSNRVCKDQPELTAGWVRTQQRTGWHLLPVQVGPQASCSGYADRMSSDLATAKQQGRAEAAMAMATARGLGIGSGSTLYYDLEDYDLRRTTAVALRCPSSPAGPRPCTPPLPTRASTPTSRRDHLARPSAT